MALGSIPRKNEYMSSSPKVDLTISTGRTGKDDSPLYFITFEVTAVSNIVPELFVLMREDPASNTYAFSRVASLKDVHEIGVSPVTVNDSYRASTVTVETNSLAYLNELREGVQLVLQSLLDEASKALDIFDDGEVTTITLIGEAT